MLLADKITVFSIRMKPYLYRMSGISASGERGYLIIEVNLCTVFKKMAFFLTVLSYKQFAYRSFIYAHHTLLHPSCHHSHPLCCRLDPYADTRDCFCNGMAL